MDMRSLMIITRLNHMEVVNIVQERKIRMKRRRIKMKTDQVKWNLRLTRLPE